jgi:hypothetical protein
MAHLCRRPGLAQKSELSGFVTQISFANDLQGYRAPEIDIEGLVGDAHRAPAQLDWSAIRIQHHFVVLESPNLRPTVSLSSAGC